jgi:hypothetical protein
MAKLRLGPVPDDKPVTRTIKLTAALDADLRAYAEIYAASFGAITVERLIPAMLERFIRSDRGFKGRTVPKVPADRS